MSGNNDLPTVSEWDFPPLDTSASALHVLTVQTLPRQEFVLPPMEQVVLTYDAATILSSSSIAPAASSASVEAGNKVMEETKKQWLLEAAAAVKDVNRLTSLLESDPLVKKALATTNNFSGQSPFKDFAGQQFGARQEKGDMPKNTLEITNG